jgi:RNA polymerase sigma-70 factor (ECF subfamily)
MFSRQKEKQFLEVYHQYSSFVFNLAYRLTGKRDSAEDLAQDAFLKIFRFLDGYRGGSLKGWLYRIVVNLFFNRAREGRNHEVELEEGCVVRESRKFDPSGNPGHFVEHHYLDGEIQQALDSIPEGFRTAIILSDIEGLSYQEIADIVGCPIGTVRSRLARSRQMLKTALCSPALVPQRKRRPADGKVAGNLPPSGKSPKGCENDAM